MDKKNSAHNRYLWHPTRANKQSWTLLRAELQRKFRRLKVEWWIAQAKKTQKCADDGWVQGFLLRHKESKRTSFKHKLPT